MPLPFIEKERLENVPLVTLSIFQISMNPSTILSPLKSSVILSYFFTSCPLKVVYSDPYPISTVHTYIVPL